MLRTSNNTKTYENWIHFIEINEQLLYLFWVFLVCVDSIQFKQMNKEISIKNGHNSTQELKWIEENCHDIHPRLNGSDSI